MKKIFKHILTLVSAVVLLSACAEENTRGWYDAPWVRYEAEADVCEGQCIFLPQSDNKLDVQNEASHQMAASLVNKGDYVEWKCKEAAEGMVIRFSLPDAPQGGGTKGNVALYSGNEKVRDIELDSYHAWQWKTPGYGPFNWYFDNTPGEDRCSRMAYDEKRVLLAEKIRKGEKFRLVKTDDNQVPYTIDFVELEPVPTPVSFEEVNDGNAVCYDGTEGIAEFVAHNQGKTIYIPLGHYDCPTNIVIKESNTKLIGAGSWYTEIHYTADPNDPATVYGRGIAVENQPDNFTVKGIYFDTDSDRRYLNYHNEVTGISGLACGMGVLGAMGENFHMEDLWIEHFECGTWLSSFKKDAYISECRIRNNYADGLNVEQAENLLVERINSRNNGDDQIATHFTPSVTTGPVSTTIRNCTIELGWRAGGMSLGSGNNIDIYDLHIEDHWETALRFLSEFPYRSYGGYVKVHDVTILNCGSRGGDPLQYGSFFNGGASADILFSSAGRLVDIKNVTLQNIDVINSHANGLVFSDSGGSRLDCRIDNVRISNWTPSFNGQDYYAVSFGSKAKGEVKYRNLILDGDESHKMNAIPETMIFEEIKD